MLDDGGNGLDFTKIADLELRWPKEGDRLFGPADHGGGTPVAQSPDQRLAYMIEGYRLAGEKLVETATTRHGGDEALLFPIVFLYRHVIELSLKEIIETFGPAYDVPTDRSSHALTPLWGKYRKICSAMGIAADDEAAAHVEAIIAEFDEVDRGSFAFRYAFDKTGTPTDLKHREIDLVRLADVMKAVANYIGGAFSYMWDRDEMRRDYIAEMWSERLR